MSLDDINIEPVHVTLRVGCAYTGDSRSAMYNAISEGKVQAVKEGRRTLLVFESLKQRAASRPLAVIGTSDKSNEKFRQLRELRKPAPLNPNDPKRWDWQDTKTAVRGPPKRKRAGAEA